MTPPPCYSLCQRGVDTEATLRVSSPRGETQLCPQEPEGEGGEGTFLSGAPTLRGDRTLSGMPMDTDPLPHW